MEAAADAIVHYLRDQFVDESTGEPSLALVRFYKALPFERLEPELQDVARAAAPDLPSLAGVPCLTLLGTAGLEPEWNDRRLSRSHRAIPLPSIEGVRRLPMVHSLIRDLGVPLDHVTHPDPARTRQISQRPGNVFYVPEALGSPRVPDQDDFVKAYGIRSVVGVGGVLPSGAMFALLLFSTTPIPRETAETFSVLAVSAKVAVLPFVERRVFDSETSTVDVDAAAATDRELRIADSLVDALRMMLDVRERAVAVQSARLQEALDEAYARAEELARSRVSLAASEARTAAILSGALDSIISMGADGKVLEFNAAAETTFGYRRDEAIGQLLAELIVPPDMRQRHTEGLARHLETGKGTLINRRVEVTAVRRDGTELPVELTITPVLGSDPPAFTGYLRDITERQAARAELVASRERQAHIARTLQASLLPPELPEVPRVELSSVYCPAGEGIDVGGDFYDVFELSDTSWALVLGDVCGKGPEAAAITALVRYTLRAAAIRNPADPAAVLREVHRAMERQRPDTFCTAAYAVLSPDRTQADIVLAGHPAVLLVRSSGEVVPVGGRGPLLGLADRWEAETERVSLDPGDTVVFYSDGVTEARGGGELFGSYRLAEVASGAAGDGAKGLVNAIETAVVDFADELSDDVAILAARLR